MARAHRAILLVPGKAGPAVESGRHRPLVGAAAARYLRSRRKEAGMDPERLLRRLAEAGADADYELDLRGLDLAHAAEAVRRRLGRERGRLGKSVAVRVDT